MSTAVDDPAPAVTPPRLPRWWLMSELFGLIIVVLVGLAVVGSTANDVTAAAASAAARAIEQASPVEHHDHGHEVTGEDTVICGVHVFGVEPADAATLAEVRTVYGFFFCAIGQPGVAYLDSSRSDGPVVVHLGPPPTVLIAAPGTGWADRVRTMMPDQYEDQCFHGLPDDRVAAGVRARYLAALGG